MKKIYKRMLVEPYSVGLESAILTGSLTTTKINVSAVEVEEFDAGFDIGPEHNDFQNLSFD